MLNEYRGGGGRRHILQNVEKAMFQVHQENTPNLPPVDQASIQTEQRGFDSNDRKVVKIGEAVREIQKDTCEH